jgi:hypothetical protein
MALDIWTSHPSLVLLNDTPRRAPGANRRRPFGESRVVRRVLFDVGGARARWTKRFGRGGAARLALCGADG